MSPCLGPLGAAPSWGDFHVVAESLSSSKLPELQCRLGGRCHLPSLLPSGPSAGGLARLLGLLGLLEARRTRCDGSKNQALIKQSFAPRASRRFVPTDVLACTQLHAAISDALL